MEKDETKTWIFIGLILLAAIIPSTIVILEWYIKNILTPIGTIEQIAWVLSFSNPWMWVLGFFLLIIGALITKALREWFKEKVGI